MGFALWFRVWKLVVPQTSFALFFLKKNKNKKKVLYMVVN